MAKKTYRATEKIALTDEIQLEICDTDTSFAFRLVNTRTHYEGAWTSHRNPGFLHNPATMYLSGYYVYWMPGQAPIGLEDECLYYIHKVNP